VGNALDQALFRTCAYASIIANEWMEIPMLTNVSLLYAGTPSEQGALAFAAAVADGLGASVDCRYAADMLSLLSADQRAEYRALIEVDGLNRAQDYLIRAYESQRASHADAAQAAYRKTASASHLIWGEPLDLRGDPRKVLSAMGFTHDMIVGSFDLPPAVLQPAIEQVLIAAGAPIALIAHAPKAASLEQMTMLYAWKPSAAAKHALRYALPLFKKARQVYLVSIEDANEPAVTPTVQDIADYLMNVHSVATSPMVIQAADTPQIQLADLYQETGADLLAMGAYSHSRLQRLFFGDFTSHFLKKRPCNLLLAH